MARSRYQTELGEAPPPEVIREQRQAYRDQQSRDAESSERESRRAAARRAASKPSDIGEVPAIPPAKPPPGIEGGQTTPRKAKPGPPPKGTRYEGGKLPAKPPERDRKQPPGAAHRIAEKAKKAPPLWAKPEEPTYAKKVREGLRLTKEQFTSGEARKRLSESLAALSGRQQKVYHDQLDKFSRDTLQYNAKVNDLNKSIQAVEKQGGNLPLDIIKDYNRAASEIEKRATYLETLAKHTNVTSEGEVARYNQQVTAFNRMVLKLQDKEPKVNEAMRATKDFNDRVERLSAKANRLEPLGEPKAPPKNAPNVVRGVFEGIKKEYKTALEKGHDTKKKAENVAALTAKVFIPLVWLKDAKGMSDSQKAVNFAIDAIVLIPILRIAGTGVKGAIRAGTRGSARRMLSQSLQDTRAATKTIKSLYGDKAASSLKTVSNSQVKYYKQLTKLERLKQGLKPTAVQEKIVKRAERELRDSAKKFVDNLTDAKAKVVSKAEADLKKKWGMELSTKKTARLKAGLTFNEKDIIEYTKDLAKAVSGKGKPQDATRLERQIANVKIKMKLPSNDPLFHSERFGALQRQLYVLNTRLSQARMYDMSDTYRRLLATRDRLGDFYKTRANLKSPSNIKNMDREIIKLERQKGKLEGDLKYGLKTYSADYSALSPKRLDKLQKQLVSLRDEATDLEGKIASSKKTKANLVAEASKKTVQRQIDRLEKQLTKKRMEIYRTRETLAKRLKTLPEYGHPKAKGPGGAPTATTTKLVTRPGVEKTTTRITGSTVKGEVGAAVKTLEAALVVAIGRPLTKEEFKTFTRETVDPDTIRKIATEIERKASAAERVEVRATPATRVDEAARIKEIEGIMRKGAVAIKEEVKLLPKPKPAEAAKPQPKTPVPVAPAAPPPPKKPLPKKPPLLRPKPRPRVRLLPVQADTPDEEKREYLEKVEGFVARRRGALGGKSFWRINYYPYGKSDELFVLGAAPKGAKLATGKGSVSRSATLLKGVPPKKPIYSDTGAVDDVITARGRRIIITSVRDKAVPIRRMPRERIPRPRERMMPTSRMLR